MCLSKWSIPWLALLLAGCAAAHAQTSAPPAAAPVGEDGAGAPPAHAPREATVDEAALAFERAERELETVVAVATGGDLDAAGSPEEATEGAAQDRAEPAGPPPAARPRAQSPTTPMRQSPDACERACRALASMTRSSDRLCSLTGDGDPRCENVRQRLGRARGTVRRACPACSG